MANAAWGSLRLDGLRRQQACGFPDVPLDRVQPVTAVGDVGDAEVLGGRQQVLDALGNQRAQRDLEGQRADVDVVVSPRGGMQVDAVAA